MSKTTHEQAREDVYILNRKSVRLRLENEHEQRLNDYISKQEKLEKELDNTIIIANSRLERLNGLELEFDKQQKLFELYKKWFIKTSNYIENYSNELAGNLSYDLYCFTKQIKELENE